VLKGLPNRRGRLRPRAAQRDGATVTVIGGQIGWLIGGLVVVETLFT